MLKKLDIRGSALAEFGITLPLFVTFIYGTIILNDLIISKIKALDVARYTVFAYAQTKGSEYGAVHNALSGGSSNFSANQIVINSMIKNIWGDLDPSTIGDGAINIFKGGTGDTKINIDDGRIKEIEAPILYSGGNDAMDIISEKAEQDSELTKALSSIKNGYKTILDRANFNTKGMVSVDLEIEMENKMITTNDFGKSLFRLFLPDQFLSPIKINTGLVMMTDSWKLEKGDDVELSKYGEAYHMQVQQMWMGTFDPALAIGDLIGGEINKAMSDSGANLEIVGNVGGGLASWGIDALLGMIPGQPFAVRVTSHAYGRDNGDENSGMVDIYSLNGANAEGSGTVRKHHTIPMVEDPNNTKNSEYYKTFSSRGNFFMGCTKGQERRCTHNGEKGKWEE